MNRRWPAPTSREELIGFYDPLVGDSEPREYIPALTRRLRELGVEILEDQIVREFIRCNGQMTGVRTNTASFEADAVVCTAYSWTLPLLGKLGWKLWVKTFVHQRYVTRPLSAPVKIPAVNANPLLGYVRPGHGNRLLLGIETDERAEYSVPALDWHMSGVSADAEPKDTFMKHFSSLTPDLAETEWETEEVGLLTFSMHGEPIRGPVQEFPGLHMAIAFHSGGFAYNPVAGFLMAEIVVDGRSSIDVSTFSPKRFDPKAVDEHLTTTVAQKNAARRRHWFMVAIQLEIQI